MGSLRLILIVAACLSVTDIKNEQCRVGCLWLGYDSGGYLADKKSCLCSDLKEFEAATKTKRLPIKINRPSHPRLSEEY